MRFIKIALVFILFYHISSVFAEGNSSNHRADTLRVKELIRQGNLLKKTDPQKAYKIAGEAINRSLLSSYSNGLMNSLLLYGVLLKNSGKFDLSVKCYFAALNIAEKNDDLPKVSTCLNNIGSVYQGQDNLIEAKKYFSQSLEIEKKINDKAQMSIRLYNLGTIYELLDSLTLAKAFYYNSLSIEEELGNKEGIYYALYGIAGINNKENDFINAQKNIQRAISLAQELEDMRGLASCYLELGNIYGCQKNYSEAIETYHLAIKKADDFDFKNEERAAYYELSSVFAKMNRLDSAYIYLIKFNTLNEMMSGIEAQNKIAELKEKFELQKKETEIELLKKQQEIKNREIKHQKTTRNYLILIIILSIAFVGLNIRNIYKGISKRTS